MLAEVRVRRTGCGSVKESRTRSSGWHVCQKTIFAIASATVIVKTASAKKHFTPNRGKRGLYAQLLALDRCRVAWRQGRLG